MKIKYLQGGALSLPFAVYQPFILPEETSSEEKSSTSKKEKNNLELDLIYDVLKELKGLPGDRYAVTNKLLTLLRTVNMKLNDPMGNTGSIEREYLLILNYVQDLQNLLNRYDKAYEHAMNNGSLGEVVIDSYGRVMATDGNGFDWITPEEYFNDSDNYLLITNGLLLQFREQGTGGLSFDSASINAVASSISTKDLTALLLATISNLGKETNSQESYIAVRANKLIKGILDYQEALIKSGKFNASVQDLYKADLLTENSAKQAKAALAFLYASLPENYKSLLKMKSNGQDSGAKALIGTLITLNADEKQDFNIELKHSSLGVTSTSSNSGIDRTFVTDFLAGFGANTERFELNPESLNEMSTNMDVYSSIKKPDGTYVGNTSVFNALLESDLIKIALTSKMYFGNQVVTEEDLKDLLYKSGAIARVEMPVDSEGKPNFELFELYEKFQAEVTLGDRSIQELLESDLYKSLRPYITKENRKKNFKPFLVMTAYTSEALLKISEDNKYVVDKESDSELYNAIKYYLAQANPHVASRYEDLDHLDWGELFTFGQYDHVYSGTLYIPINMSKQAATLGLKNIDINNTSGELEYQLSQKDYNPVNGPLPK